MKITLSILTFWLWIPLLVVGYGLSRGGLPSLGARVSMIGLMLSGIGFNVQ